jgi:hypothetical protein
MNEKQDLLRHTLATLAYRANRALEGSSGGFGSFAGAGRQPVEILAHMGDLMDWALSIVNGKQRWQNSAPLAWVEEQKRFFAALTALDQRLAAAEPSAASEEKLFQGAIADALTHVGQIAMLRRLAGEPAKGENFYVAEIVVGRTGAEQPQAKKTF